MLSHRFFLSVFSFNLLNTVSISVYDLLFSMSPDQYTVVVSSGGTGLCVMV